MLGWVLLPDAFTFTSASSCAADHTNSYFVLSSGCNGSNSSAILSVDEANWFASPKEWMSVRVQWTCHYVDAVLACFCILLQNAQPFGKTSMSNQRLDTGCDLPCSTLVHTRDKMMVYLVVQVGVAFGVLQPYLCFV